ncbi:MAG TPA: glycosyltransferase family 4 protein, partial [Thauera aminoaromatica]|nr:glycosyltransferase family 4 protein [Thauera aminoaromatica]
PAARLSIAGSGPEAAALAALAQELGIAERVRFTGRLDREQMAALYRDADLMLNPSRVDNMPNAILEALASGLPVVTTDVGGIPFIVTQGHTAMLVPPDDPQAMADAAHKVLADTGLRAALVAAGCAEVQRYRWSSVRAQLLSAYADAIAAKRAT